MSFEGPNVKSFTVQSCLNCLRHRRVSCQTTANCICFKKLRSRELLEMTRDLVLSMTKLAASILFFFLIHADYFVRDVLLNFIISMMTTNS